MCTPLVRFYTNVYLGNNFNQQQKLTTTVSTTSIVMSIDTNNELFTFFRILLLFSTLFPLSIYFCIQMFFSVACLNKEEKEEKEEKRNQRKCTKFVHTYKLKPEVFLNTTHSVA